MKKYLYLAIVATILVACGKSQEQKAESLIKDNLKKTLYKPDTYKPIETKVDSAFAPYDNPAFYEELVKLGEMNNEYSELEEKAKRAKSTMAIWSGPYLDAYGRNQHQEAKEDYDKANAEMEKIQTKAQKQIEKVVTMFQEGRKFIGYKAVHNFRADNNMGNTLIGNQVFFIDKKFTEVLYTLDVEEYNEIQKAISQLKEQIDDSGE